MQECGNNGSWEGLLELRELQRKEGVKLFPIARNIALTALTNCLKDKRKYRVVTERVPVALEMAKVLWREVEPVGDVQTFNSGLSSTLKLATCLDCEAAYQWGLEVWRQARPAGFQPNYITLSAYISFLEHYQCCDEVDTLLDSQDGVVSQAVNVVLLSSLLDCIALRKDWERADSVWEQFMAKGIQPNIIAFRTLAKVHLLAGHPLRVVKIFQSLSSSGTDLTEDSRTTDAYVQASLIVCHSSLDPAAMKRLEAFLALALDKCRKGPKGFREDLLKMRQVLEQLLSKSREVYLHEVLIEWKAKEQSVMAEWENFPAGSNYLEDQSAFKNSKQAKHTRGDSQLLAPGAKSLDMWGLGEF